MVGSTGLHGFTYIWYNVGLNARVYSKNTSPEYPYNQRTSEQLIGYRPYTARSNSVWGIKVNFNTPNTVVLQLCPCPVAEWLERRAVRRICPRVTGSKPVTV